MVLEMTGTCNMASRQDRCRDETIVINISRHLGGAELCCTYGIYPLALNQNIKHVNPFMIRVGFPFEKNSTPSTAIIILINDYFMKISL